MDLEIGKGHLFLPIARYIWIIAMKLNSDLENSNQMFEIKNAFIDLKQGDLSITKLYSMKTNL